MSVLSSEFAPTEPSPASECVPTGTKGGGGQHSLVGEGAGSQSDDWRECLSLCLLCDYTLQLITSLRKSVNLKPKKTTFSMLVQRQLYSGPKSDLCCGESWQAVLFLRSINKQGTFVSEALQGYINPNYDGHDQNSPAISTG